MQELQTRRMTRAWIISKARDPITPVPGASTFS
jgi:hypothetical protein